MIFCVLALLVGSGVLLFRPQALTGEDKLIGSIPRKEEAPANKVSGDEPVTLLFVGDIMLSRKIGEMMEQKDNWNFPFEEIANHVREADIAFGNLEGPISSRGQKSGSIYSFRADPRSVAGLLYAGFDVLSLANNHMLDYGEIALSDTLDILKKNGLVYAGGGKSEEETRSPVIKEVGGVKFAYLAYTRFLRSSYVGYMDQIKIKEDIEKAASSADFVIVSYHAGEEYELRHNAFQEKFAHLAVDAGADLVIGHHPHTPQDTEYYNGAFIAYSLGNFIFDQNFSEETSKGLMLKVVVRNKKIENIEPINIKFNKFYQPYVVQ